MLLNNPANQKTKHTKRIFRHRGQSLIETLAGFMVLIPLGLFSFDLTIIVMANQINKEVSENSARAASNQVGLEKATQAAIGAINKVRTSAIITNITLLDVDYNIGTGKVSVTTEVDVKLPVTYPGIGKINLRCTSVEPILAIPSPA